MRIMGTRRDLGGLQLMTTVLVIGTCVGSVEALGKWPLSTPLQSASKAPVFEVASVKANTSGGGSMSMGWQPGGGFRAVNAPLRSLIRTAFDVRDTELVGAPDWISSERFDVTAKAAAELAPAARSSALETLLRERFKLMAHRDVREVPVYLLVLARRDERLGPGLRPSQIDCSPEARAARRPTLGAGAGLGAGAAGPGTSPATRPECGSISIGPTLISGGVTLAQLASSLTRQTDRPVVLPDQLLVIGNRLQGRNISAVALIRSAYGPQIVSRDQVVDGPAWIGSERFDIDARTTSVVAETATGQLPPAVAQMLRTALEERFQLRVRRETRALPRYALMYARADRSLKPGIRLSSLDCTAKRDISGPCEFRPSPGNLVMRGRSIGSFVEFLSRPAYAGGLVFDDTGITGNVDIDLQWSMEFTDLPASTASLFTAIQEQLGLKLEHRQIPLPVAVVEHIQRPSEN